MRRHGDDGVSADVLGVSGEADRVGVGRSGDAGYNGNATGDNADGCLDDLLALFVCQNLKFGHHHRHDDAVAAGLDREVEPRLQALPIQRFVLVERGRRNSVDASKRP